MLEKQEREELIWKIKDLRTEISILKNKLNESNKEKEKWFSKKENLKDEIKELVKQIKNIKNISDTTTKGINDYRKERDNYNDKVRQLVKEIKKLNGEKKEIFSKLNVKDPVKIKKDIDRLEESIEIEAFSFDKEKEIMKKIKGLKKIYQESSQATELLDKIDGISEEIEDTRKKAQDIHEKFIDSLKGNKETFNSFMELSKKISNLKREQEEAFENFINFKKEFSTMNNIIKEKILELNVIQNKLDDDRKEEKVKIYERQKSIVEEKLKSKKKLTTEDLIVFQEEK
ncbi:hypothetical protein HYX17_03290 [Candidatus Woesearchaeota archaeon]|nr:hypothetical protein [Candidatus Woesearchaeota archaeon]